MSSIDKLQILGVRSFDNKKSQIIQFYKPLTLIVGLNGSGKTTIIECLRYATTGELPPNSATGGAWIHDTKLAGENEVLAQVRLLFNSVDGSRMTASRNIQVTVKKTQKSQKALDCTLLKIKNGERSTVSSRVADLDTLIPSNLGVSKAILESVIFCHQDDSLWPMSTPAILKKKFDEIFDAQKYTRAVDNIKVIKKNLDVERKVMEAEEKGQKRNKDLAVINQTKSTKLDAEMEKLRVQKIALEAEIKKCIDNSQRAFDNAGQVGFIVSELRGKRYEANGVQETIDTLKATMRLMSDSDEALRSMLEQYEDRLAHNESDKEAFTKTYRELLAQIQQNREALGDKQAELGTLRGQKQRYEQQVTSRKDLIKDTARRHGVRGFDTDITDDHVRDFMEKIARLAREQQNAFEKAKKEIHEENQAAQQELTTLNGRRSELTQTKTSANAYVQQNDSKISQQQSTLDGIEVNEGSKAVLESNLGDLEHRLTKLKESFATAAYETKITNAEGQLRALDDDKERVDLEMLEASRRAKDSARLDLLHKDLKDRQQGLDTVTGAYSERINKILHTEWEPSTLEQTYHTVSTEKSNAVKEAEQQRDGVLRESDHIKVELSGRKSTQERKEKEFADHEEAVSQVTSAYGLAPAKFLEVLDKVEVELEAELSAEASYQAMLEYWQKSEVVLDTKDRCVHCKRSFKLSKEDAEHVHRVEIANAAKAAYAERIQAALLAAETGKNAEGKAQKQKAMQVAKSARPRFEAWIALKSELPQIRAEVKDLQTKLETCNRQLEEKDQDVAERLESKREVDAVAKTIQSIIKYQTDIGSIEAQIKQLAASQQSFTASRGLEQIQDDQKKLSEKIRTATISLQQLRIVKDRAQNDLTSMEFQVRDSRSQLSAVLTQLKEKSQLEGQIEDLKTQNAAQRNAIRNADQELQSLSPKIAQVQAKLQDIRARGDERERALQKEVNKLSDSSNQLRIADQEISSYLDRGGPQKLVRAEREISNIHQEISRIEDEQRTITVQIKKLENELSNHNETKRAIIDNLTYREKLKRREILEQEISDLEAHNAEADVERFTQEGKDWAEERNRAEAKEAQIVGELKSKDVQLLQLMQEWETEYQDANDLWRRSKVKLVVTKAAIGDLGRYGGALDQAIMKYHSLKMEEINRIIDELWRNTYQGTDVDTIMIKSESETANKNKSYNYRVVMRKQDAEMDMRGRCSAGQKVLASIIIRLALAECFGVRCGLIALDEPTTNLDRDNIIALAESLSQIIKNRREQSNFQLIVITHDEEFLKSMNCADYTDYYWRVGRDANMCSEIYKQNIQNVSATQTDNEWQLTEFAPEFDPDRYDWPLEKRD